MKDFFLIDHQIQPIRHCIPDIDPGKSDCKDERKSRISGSGSVETILFFHHGSSSFIHSLSATPLSRLHCSFPKLPLPFLSFPLYQTVIPSRHRNHYKKGEAAFLLLSYYVMLSYFHPVSFSHSADSSRCLKYSSVILRLLCQTFHFLGIFPYFFRNLSSA